MCGRPSARRTKSTEVQVLYTEPGAKELYFFVNNRLDRIVR